MCAITNTQSFVFVVTLRINRTCEFRLPSSEPKRYSLEMKFMDLCSATSRGRKCKFYAAFNMNTFILFKKITNIIFIF